MTKRERVLAALKGEKTDRIPYSVYMHSTVHYRTVRKFTEFTLDFHRKFDPDYVKVMYDENYDTPVNFQCVSTPEQWKQLEELDPHIGAFGRQLEVLKRVRDALGPDIPVVQTIFSAFHIGYRLASKRILADWDRDRNAVEQGLAAIAESTNRFAECCLKEAGIDGFFYAAFGCEREWMDQARYREMVMPLDLRMMAPLRHAPILILHIHGERGPMFDLLKDYECDAISWEDRLAGPPIAEARRTTGKCLVGGIDHYAALSCTPEEIVRQGADAISQTGGRGLILAPGCTFFEGTPEENMLAMKRAAASGL